MSPDWTFKSLIHEMGIISHRGFGHNASEMLSTVPGTADVVNDSSIKKPQTLLCCFCHYVWDPRGLAPPTSGGPGASHEYMLDLNNNPIKVCRLRFLLLHIEKVCSGNTETLPKASAFQTTSPGLLHSIPGSLTGPSLSHYLSQPLTQPLLFVSPSLQLGTKQSSHLCCTEIANV